MTEVIPPLCPLAAEPAGSQTKKTEDTASHNLICILYALWQTREGTSYHYAKNAVKSKAGAACSNLDVRFPEAWSGSQADPSSRGSSRGLDVGAFDIPFIHLQQNSSATEPVLKDSHQDKRKRREGNNMGT